MGNTMQEENPIFLKLARWSKWAIGIGLLALLGPLIVVIFYLRAGIRLGHLPIPFANDPKYLGLDLLHELSWEAMELSFPIEIAAMFIGLVVWALCMSNPKMFWKQSLLALVGHALYGVFSISPILTWLLD
jgi:hypothetical protein